MCSLAVKATEAKVVTIDAPKKEKDHVLRAPALPALVHVSIDGAQHLL